MAEIFLVVVGGGGPQQGLGRPAQVRLGDAVTGSEFGEANALIKSETGEQ
jgi:hypothetical protein